MNKQETIAKARSYFNEGYACSQSVLLTFADQYNIDENTAKLISSTFGGGMGRLRQKCGAVTGGFMVLGLANGNINPKDLDTKLAAYEKVRDLNHSVENIYGTSICAELLEKYSSESEVAERQHHQTICGKIIEDVAGLLYDMIEQQK